MQNQSIKKVVAIGIGSALFVIIGMLINIPTPVPNTNIQLQYALLALFAIIYGPSVGFFTGLIGHSLKDALQSGNPWWTWIIVSALFGLVMGLLSKKIDIEKGYLTTKDYVWFNVTQLVANIIGWAVIVPMGDIAIYSEAANKVYAQGFLSALVNSLTVAIGGSLLLALYAKSRTKAGSLKKD
ncbi:ECF-type riboflavin transporter substrate-binding protein [Streptococcus sp. zg-JUN1979]|uniref:ECF-type riboflavin transporter substrate-binding protein n=1 Tax=Streptococcus sp. zg-JUN1979 TaxID=3391450 RepID=UPI0039A709C6